MAPAVRRLSHALGAKITGVDLREPLGNATQAEIHRAWLEHHVNVFPGQKFTPAQQIAFGRTFGELDDHKSAPFYPHPEHPETGRKALYVNEMMTSPHAPHHDPRHTQRASRRRDCLKRSTEEKQ